MAKKKEVSALERSLIGPAGEHFALYRLHRMGMLAALAPTNAPTVDILVMNPDETVAATLQVKTTTYGADQGWPMNEKHERIVQGTLFYALVDFKSEVPVTYIVPSRVVADVVRLSHQTWLKQPGKKGQPHNATEMRELRRSYSFPIPGVTNGWIDEYREAWDLLRVGLGSHAKAATGGS